MGGLAEWLLWQLDRLEELLAAKAGNCAMWEYHHDDREAVYADLAFGLSDIAAKRALVTLCAKAAAGGGGFWPTDSQDLLAEHALRLLAVPFHDRPGYRSEWKPQ